MAGAASHALRPGDSPLTVVTRGRGLSELYSAATATAAFIEPVCAKCVHGAAPSSRINTDYSLWYYSLHRNSIVTDMQQHRTRRVARTSAEDRFGQALREFRAARGITQEELAFQSGYHPTYIGQLERGKKSPSLRTIVSLASVLKTRGSELLKRVEALETKATG